MDLLVCVHACVCSWKTFRSHKFLIRLYPKKARLGYSWLSMASNNCIGACDSPLFFPRMNWMFAWKMFSSAVTQRPPSSCMLSSAKCGFKVFWLEESLSSDESSLLLYRATVSWSKGGRSWTMTSPSVRTSTWRMESSSEFSTCLKLLMAEYKKRKEHSVNAGGADPF